METLEVQAKDFLVKWVNAPENSSIKWQVKSLKKSVNFAIYQKVDFISSSSETELQKGDTEGPGFESASALGASTPMLPSRLRSTSVTSITPVSRLNTFKNRSRSSTFSSSLSNSGLTLVKDYHKLLPDELMRGIYKTDKGGTFAFIFDNTFSKTTGKKIFFSAKLTTDESNHQSRRIVPQNGFDSLRGSPNSQELTDDATANILWPKDGELMQGILFKRRRKKLQGFTKRFFILNLKYGTLSYFKTNDNKLRGQMPIKESIVSADAESNQIFIDSGMEVWNLKALNAKDFKAWVNAFSVIKKRNTRAIENRKSALVTQEESTLHAQLRDVRSKVTDLILTVHTTSLEKLKVELEAIDQDLLNMLNQSVSSDIASVFSENEFFDANENLNGDGFGVVLMTDSAPVQEILPDEDPIVDNDIASEESSSGSDGESEDLPAPTYAISDKDTDFGSQYEAEDLYPLPLPPIERNCDIPLCDHYPPSLLSFVRKNVGKDLSSLSMPVDMNEPITILQKYAELLEYSDMIDNALQGDYLEDSGELILRIGAFSVSYLSAMRMKVRSSRKPFNPLLGETYELVREDKGFRMVCEKVSHRPPVFAMFAESRNWTMSFSPAPSQKFWGKTSEFYTSGSVKLTIRKTGEVFTWNQPTCVLKNIIAGEKFTEPSTSVTVKSSSGQRAVVEFAKGGMFSGRSEDLTINAYDSAKRPFRYSVCGKWTESMTLKTNSTEKIIWTAGELLAQSEKKFGFTQYAGSLNKITSIEKGFLPPTDSRFRPDMQAYEEGKVNEAEALKQKVEEGQRRRRKDLEEKGLSHQPMFFQQVDGEPDKPDSGEWIYKNGKLSYWERRKAHNWAGVPEIW
ncbi:Pleckstrin-likey domain-containing protein [Metschnikowia aff. pulcherrima]|uniref:Pleckstrin-likey domain-containing protein n=1 Tax=Metschnikowia aff. pulcherrima TaxID=2163413 RepID=A0A4V1ADK4_9ASCO|nr:Pleckstrin-likey domain-containing protein [Metschnikowia aff. pulcherrima]